MSSVKQALRAAVAAPSRTYEVLNFDDSPVHEFFVCIALNGRSKLPLPVQFKLIFDKHIQESATVREACPQQQIGRAHV